MNHSRYRLIGTSEQLADFFEVCRCASSLMENYQSLYISSWPLGGDINLGLCIEINGKVKSAESVVKAIAKVCSVKLEPLTEKESELARMLVLVEQKNNSLKGAVTAETMTKAFLRVIDYECYGILTWMKQSAMANDMETWGKYQSAYNHLVALRERITCAEWALAYLDTSKFDMPEAKLRIFNP